MLATGIRCRANRIAAIGILALLSLVEDAAAGDWPTLGANEQRSSWSTSFVPDFSQYDSSGLIDEFQLPELAGETSVVIYEGLMFVHGYDQITALDMSVFPPTVYWMHPTGDGASSSFGTPAAFTLNLDVDLDGDGQSKIVSVPIICYGHQHSVTCRVCNDVAGVIPGEILWGGAGPFVEPDGWFGFTSPVIDVYCDPCDSMELLGIVWATTRALSDQGVTDLIGIDIDTGSEVARFTPTSPYGVRWSHSPTRHPVEPIVYFMTEAEGSAPGSLQAVLAERDEPISLLWSYTFLSAEVRYGAPVVFADKVLAAGVNEVVALNALDGSLAWTQSIPGAGVTGRPLPFAYGDKVIVSAATGYNSADTSFVYAFDIDDGKLIWQSEALAGGTWNSPTAADSKIVVGTNSTMYVLSSLDGATLWSYDFDCCCGFDGVCPGEGDCCAANETPGCEDSECCSLVCAIDAFCCKTLWDELCGEQAIESCEICGSSDPCPGVCCDTWGFWGFPTIVDNAIYVVNGAGTVTVFRADTVYSEQLALPQGTTLFDARSTTDSTIEFTMNSAASGTVIISKYSTADDAGAGSGTVQTEDGTAVLRKYIDVSMPAEMQEQMQEATVRLYYTDDELWESGIINEGLMRLYLWNEDLEEWEELQDSGVDIENNIVFGTTTNFSVVGGGGPLLDSDGDGIPDLGDNCPFDANEDQNDADSDAVGDACDTCPSIQNGAQGDVDGDGLGDICDPDADDDGIPNEEDQCPHVAAPQMDDDNDGVGNDCDNCPDNANPDQADTDADGLGNVCDPNDDNDAWDDPNDTCPQIHTIEPVDDSDGDGVGDLCDACPDEDASGQDVDGDGCIDVCPADTNGDGEVDVEDLVNVILAWDSDGHGQPGIDTDVDGSGTVDVADLVVVVLGWGPCE